MRFNKCLLSCRQKICLKEQVLFIYLEGFMHGISLVIREMNYQTFWIQSFSKGVWYHMWKSTEATASNGIKFGYVVSGSPHSATQITVLKNMKYIKITCKQSKWVHTHDNENIVNPSLYVNNREVSSFQTNKNYETKSKESFYLLVECNHSLQ